MTIEHSTEVSKPDRDLAVICHALSFSGSILPFGNIVGPLILWQLKKDESAFLDEHGKECVNFQISLTLWLLACIPLVLVIVGIPLLLLLAVAGIVFTVLAIVKASKGEHYRYPLTIRFIR